MTDIMPRRRVAFDPTINLGHVLTFVGFMVAGFSAYSTLDKRVTLIESQIVASSTHVRDQDSRLKETLRLSAIQITDGVLTNGPRGEVPGAYHCPQSGLATGIGGDVLLTKGTAQFSGKTILSLSAGNPNGSPSGTGFFDVTGPWREG